jgi:hypothetical protein
MQISKISPVLLPSFKQSRPTAVAFSDQYALDTLQKELSGKMSAGDIKKWTDKVVSICDRLHIQPKQLPINPDLPGNLTREQNRQFFKEVVLDTFA